MRRSALDPSPERCGIFLISVLQSAIKAVTRLLRVACPSGQDLLKNKMLEAPSPQSPDPRTLVDPPTAATQRPLSSSQPLQGIWHQYGSRPRLPLAFVLSNRPDLDQQTWVSLEMNPKPRWGHRSHRCRFGIQLSTSIRSPAHL